MFPLLGYDPVSIPTTLEEHILENVENDGMLELLRPWFVNSILLVKHYESNGMKRIFLRSPSKKAKFLNALSLPFAVSFSMPLMNGI